MKTAQQLLKQRKKKIAKKIGDQLGLKKAVAKCSVCGKLGHNKLSPACKGPVKPPHKRIPKVLTPEEQKRKEEWRKKVIQEDMSASALPDWMNISPGDDRQDSGLFGFTLPN